MPGTCQPPGAHVLVRHVETSTLALPYTGEKGGCACRPWTPWQPVPPACGVDCLQGQGACCDGK